LRDISFREGDAICKAASPSRLHDLLRRSLVFASIAGISQSRGCQGWLQAGRSLSANRGPIEDSFEARATESVDTEQCVVSSIIHAVTSVVSGTK
jgi:hypothetical protein